MNTPSPIDMFMNIFAQAMGGEQFPPPGSKEWEEGQKGYHVYWAKVWMDCVNLHKYIDRLQKTCEAIDESKE